ncbi:hypothetical protein EJ06DRAFT_462895, partial [Trichodelitschia bisporula]
LPRTTLSNRFRGTHSPRTAHITQQLLSPDQEVFLTAWFRREEKSGSAPSGEEVRRQAHRILLESGN